MSARELIKEVAALPPHERTLFLQLRGGIDSGQQTGPNGPSRIWPDFGDRLRQIYGDKVAPDSQRIVNEGRGDR